MAYPLTEMSKEEIIRILRGFDSIEASPGERKAWDEFTVGTVDSPGLFPDDDTKWEDFPKPILTAAVREGEAIFGEVGDLDYAGLPDEVEQAAVEAAMDDDGSINDDTEIEVVDDDVSDIEIIDADDDEAIIVVEDEDEDGDIEVYIEDEDDNLETVDLTGLADLEDTEDEDVDPEQLAKGIEIEMEHTKDPEVAKEIALDHLTEIPDYYNRLEEMEEEAEGTEEEAYEESRQYKTFKFGKAKEKLIQELNSNITDALAELTEEELKIVNSKLVEEGSIELKADDGKLEELLENLNRLQDVGKEFFDTFKGVISDFVDESEEDEEEPVEESRGFWFDEDKVFNSDDKELVESVLYFVKKMDSSDPRIKKLEDRLAELEAPTEESKKAKDILKSIFEEEMDKDGNIDNFDLSNNFSVEFVKNVSDLDKDEMPGKQRFEIVIDGDDFVAIVDTPKQKVTWEGTKPKHHAEIGKELLFGDLYRTVGQEK